MPIDNEKIGRVPPSGLLEELKSQFQRELEIRSTLDNKATNMVTMSSAIASFIVALGTFLATSIDTSGIFFTISFIILLLSIIAATVGISFFIRSYSIKNYRFPISHEKFLENIDVKNLKIVYNEDAINDLLSKGSLDFERIMIKQYLSSIGASAQSNAAKAKDIEYGQWFFLSSIITVAILVMYTLLVSSWP